MKTDDSLHWLFLSLENVDHLLQEKIASVQPNVENSSVAPLSAGESEGEHLLK